MLKLALIPTLTEIHEIRLFTQIQIIHILCLVIYSFDIYNIFKKLYTTHFLLFLTQKNLNYATYILYRKQNQLNMGYHLLTQYFFCIRSLKVMGSNRKGWARD